MDIRQEIPIKSFSIATFICKKDNGTGKYLIIKRASKTLEGNWQMVSGLVEKGEKPWEAALREIKEETGIIPSKLFSANKMELFYEVRQNCINMVPVFLAFVDKDIPVKLNPAEHNEYKWVTFEEAKEYLTFSQQISFIKYFEEEFIKKEPNKFLEIKFKG